MIFLQYIKKKFVLVGYHEIFENEEIPDFDQVSLDASVSSVSAILSSFCFF